MQDQHRLEQLGSTAALGMWANDAILALDRMSRGKSIGEDDLVLLRGAADALGGASEEKERPDSPVSGTLAFAERALDVAERLTTGRGSDAALQLLAEVSRELRQIVEQRKVENPERTIDFFAALSRQQLAATQSVLNSRQEASWTAGPATLSFS